jgi:adenine-specific DNA-methyltransferase
MDKNEVEKLNIKNDQPQNADEVLAELKDYVERAEDAKEHYDFTWRGKAASMAEMAVPAGKIFRPDPENSVNFDTTENLYIEGDNLDALKLLQESYLGKVKMIYIDPPYNTGKDFVYHDNFHVSMDEYDEATGRVDEDGNRNFKKNDKTNGRFHSDWLSMMLPRLKLARNLLSDDGVIFISIDDNEQANLKLLCDEVFGEENFVNNFVWVNNSAGRQIQGVGAAGTHEQIFCYARKIDYLNAFELSSRYLKSIMPNSYKGFNFEYKEDVKGRYITTHELYNGNPIFNERTRANLVFDIYYRESDGDIKITAVSDKNEFPDYAKIEPHKNADGTHKYHAYRWSKDKILREKDDLEFVKSGDTYKIFTKRRDFDTTTVKDIITDITTNSGSQDVKDLGLVGFDFPKPVSLIELLANMATDKDAIIVDFFSGSGTTAHAVMKLNAEDNGNRRFILVQLPEETPENSEARKAGYTTIPEIARERIKRAGAKIAAENPDWHGDIGFRRLVLDSTNELDGVRIPAQALQQTDIMSQVENLKPDRGDLDLLFGALTSVALPLDGKLETRDAGDVKYYLYDHADEDSGVLACFAPALTRENIENFARLKPNLALFRESTFKSSADKINLGEIFKNLAPNTKVQVI